MQQFKDNTQASINKGKAGKRERLLNFVLLTLSAYSAWAPSLATPAAWQTWSGDSLPADDGSAPDLRFVDTMMRRRLGRLSRMALQVANEAAMGLPRLTTIFASRHGELSRTVTILHDLAAGEMPSPAAFSLSVHNATAGIFAIARGDHSPSTALAAGDETLLWALQEAAVRLAGEPDTPVLLVYADEPLPGEYQPFRAASGPAHALALLLRPGTGLALEWTANPDLPPSPEPLSLALLAHLLGRRETLAWHGERLSVRGSHHA